MTIWGPSHNPVREHIRHHLHDDDGVGWAMIGVLPTILDDETTLPFIYTVGFVEKMDQSEFFLYGDTRMAWILQELWEQCEQGHRFHDGELVAEIVADDYLLKMRAIDPVRSEMNAARDYYERDDFPAMQILVPDVNGHFPDEEWYDLDQRQPLLPRPR